LKQKDLKRKELETPRFENTLVGKHVILHKLQPSDADDIYKWRSGESGRYLRQPSNYSVESQVNWINSRGDNEINYIIADKISGRKVGTIGIYDVNMQDKVTNVGRLLLDEIYFRKSIPYGLEALLLTYDYVFNTMGFRKITGDILALNKDMVKLQKFLGMVEEGFLKKHVHINDEYVDIHIMSIFEDQYNKSYRTKLNFLLSSF
jgi:diamine N-acetyltransferase